jgi:hypothetical protein
MQTRVKNFAVGTLASAPNASATVLSLTAGHGARFPEVPFYATIFDSTLSPEDAYHSSKAEIVYVYSYTTDSMTVRRAQEGSTARDFSGLSCKILAAPTETSYNRFCMCKYSFVYDDFTAGTVGESGFVSSNNAGGSATAYIYTDSPGHRGQIRMTPGTTSSGGNSVLGRRGAIGDNVLTFGAAEIEIEWIACVATLSSSTNDYTVRLGCMDTSGGDPTDGVFFRYNHAVNSGQWECVSREGGTESVQQSSVAVTAGEFYRLKFLVAADASRVDFWIDSVHIGAVTTNIPNGTAWCWEGATITSNNVNAAAQYLFVDAFSMFANYTTIR